MISLTRLVQSLETRDVELAPGVRVTLRALSDGAAADVLAAFVRPVPPMKSDPAKGSLAPKVEDTDDPVFVAAMERWYRQVRRVRVAIAAGHTLADGLGFEAVATDAEKAAWMRRADAEIAQGLGESHVAKLAAALAEMTVGGGGGGGGGSGSAEKNS